LGAQGTALNITGKLAFNCNPCSSSPVDLDAPSTTVNTGSFQVSGTCPAATCVDENYMADTSFNQSSNHQDLTPTVGSAPIPLVPPPSNTTTTGSCTQGTGSARRQWTCTPGVYTSNPLSGASGGSTYTFDAGDYTLDDGLSVNANRVTVNSSGGVFFYVAGGPVTISAATAVDQGKADTTSVQLAPATTGPYAGVVLYQDPSDANPITLWANTTSADTISGAIEAPSAPVFIAADTEGITIGSLLAQSLSMSSIAVSPAQPSTVSITG
jgi:hypothetical protein